MTGSAAGGSGNVGGVQHEDRCFAWLAAHMLTETALPDWASGRLVVGVGSQTGRPVDDVGALTDADGWVCVQAKKKLTLSDRTDSDLAAALDQLVAIDEVGVPDRPPRVDELRPLNPGIDRVLILTNEEAPSTISVAMARLVDRLRTLPEAVPLAEAATNAPEHAALRTLRGHLERLWSERHGAAAVEGVVRSLVRPLAVQALDLRPEGSNLRALLPELRALLEDPRQAPNLWRELERIGQRLAAKRSWIRRPDLVEELETLGLYLTPVARLRRDVQRLKDITTDNLDSPPTSLVITTPDGPVEVRRAASALLDASGGNVAITGDPGAGKSVILHGFAVRQTADVVYLTHHQLRGTAGDTRAELNLQHDLHEVLTGWTGSRPGLLLLDGIDQTRGVDASSWLPGLAQHLRATRWRIVASIRSFDLRHGPSWQSMFGGTPIEPCAAQLKLSRVAHIWVGDMTAEEIATVHAASPSMKQVSEEAGDDLAGLLANPFNLNLVGELVGADMDISQIRSRLDLLNRFWQLRVEDAPGGRVRQHVVRSLIDSMVEARSQQTDDSQLDSAMLTALEDLLRDGVLRERPASRWAPSRLVEFAHPVLFDYAATIIALGEVTVPDSVADVLDGEPDLAMVLRPSLDYRLAIVWHNDHPSRTSYWRLALRLAAQRSGHMLAAAAAATVATHELCDGAELGALESACATAATDATWTIDDARGLAFLVAAGLDAPGRNPAALDAFGQLLERLAAHAANNDDIGLALLVAQLCRRAAGDRLPTRGTQAADSWVQAAIAAVLVGLADLSDSRRARIADHGGHALAMAATLDAAAAADTIRLVVAEPALRAWGVRAVRPLIDALPDIAGQDPALAVDLGASVWLFQDDQSQSTTITDSQILALISNRQQDLETVRFQVRQAFPALAAVDILAATRLFLKILESRSLPEYAQVGSQTNQRPWVRYGDDLQHAGGFGSLSAMADALIDRLEHIAPTCSDAFDLLIENLTHADVWNRLLHRATISESVDLANALRPVLSSPSLLAHGETWPAAGRLAAVVSRTLAAAEYHALEQIILAATEPGPDDSELRRNGLRERRAVLLAATRAARIGVDATHLLSPVLPPDDQPIEEQVSTATTELPSEARLLHEVNEALERTNRAEDHDDARRQLLALWPQLNALHVAAPSNRLVHMRVIEAAGHIASLPEVLPDTVVGREIFLAVQTAMPQPTPAGGEPGVNPNVHGNWSGTPETAALTAARVLLARPEWRQVHGEWLQGRMLSHLDSSTWIYRFLSTCAISLIYTEPDELLSQVESRLITETDHHVGGELISVLGRHLHARPGDVDLIFSRLAARRGSPYLVDPGEDGPQFHTLAEAVVHSLTTLAVRYGTPFADATIRAWLSTPIDNPRTVNVIAGHLRGILNPADPSFRDAQRRAFDLLTLTLEPLPAALADPAQAPNALTIAEGVAQEVYHASGAFKADEQSTTELGDPEVFANLALPLLDGLAQIHHPAVIHPIILTVEHLCDAQPKPVLLLALRAITEDSGYVAESLGVDAVLRLINRYIADHRELVLGDPECTTAVRVLLERFVRVGWPPAVQMAERMDELFR